MQRLLNIAASLFFTGLLAALAIIFYQNRGDVTIAIGLIIVLFLIDIVLAWTVFVSNRPPMVKTSWIFVIMVFPFFGAVMFAVFGISPLTKRNRAKFLDDQKKFTQFENFQFTDSFLGNSDRSSVHAAFEYSYRTANRPVYSSNEVRLITEGVEFHDEIIAAVKTARRFIHVQYYIVNKGEFFSELADELIAKAKAGVEVRFLYDWVGCFLKIDRKKVKEMRRAGVVVALFNLSWNPVQGGSNFRAHRKVLIVDNEIAITGGCNIGDEYMSKDSKFGYWRDTNIFLKGEVVNTLNLLFASDWEHYTKHSLKRPEKTVLLNKASHYFEICRADATNLCQVIDSGPDYQEKPIKDLLLRLIGSAKKRVWLTTPYLLPTPDIIESLRTASFAGIDVRVITPGRPDNKKSVLALTRSQQVGLMAAGVKFYEFQAFVHAKTALFDDELSLIGTFNLDFRSFYINFELAVLVGSRQLAKKLEAVFEADFANSRQILPQDRNYSLFYRKIYLGMMNIFYPLL